MAVVGKALGRAADAGGLAVDEAVGEEPEPAAHIGLAADLGERAAADEDVVGEDEVADGLGERREAGGNLLELAAVLLARDGAVDERGVLLEDREEVQRVDVVLVCLGRVVAVVLEQERVAQEALHGRDEKHLEVPRAALRVRLDLLQVEHKRRLLLGRLVDHRQRLAVVAHVHGICVQHCRGLFVAWACWRTTRVSEGERTKNEGARAAANNGHDGLGDAARLVPVADDGGEEVHDALRVAEDLLDVRKDGVDGLGLDDGLVAQAPQAPLLARRHIGG